MLHDARNSETALNRRVDVAIVGAGAAGITLARKLSRDRRVLLIESGDLTFDHDTQNLYAGTLSGLDYPLTASRQRYFGGTTNHWGGWCGLFDDEDFEPRAWVPYSGWPIAHTDLRPYYDETAQILDLGAARFDLDEVLPADSPVLRARSTRLTQRMFRFSDPVTRFGSKYRQELAGSDRVDVLLNANLTEMLLDESGQRLDTLVIKTLNGRTGTIHAHNVILACGAIENARLLLASRRQIPTGIGNRHDLVGRFFMEHPHIIPGEFLMHDREWCASASAMHRDGAHRFGVGLTLTPSALREYQCLNFTGHFFDRNCDADAAIPFGAMTDQAPNPDSRVQLAAETDALGVPRTRLNWQLTDLDWHTLKSCGEILGREFGRLGLGRGRVRSWVLERNPVGSLGGGSHHMGTTRMSDSPLTGVVTAECRVHDVDNLYIAGSSVYCTGSAINPTFTLTALALRLADHLVRAS